MNLTIDDAHMWCTLMPEAPDCLEIFVSVESVCGIGAVKIYNYNKSLLESIKGIKELEIILDQFLVWDGTLNKGTGKENDSDICTLIKFNADV